MENNENEVTSSKRQPILIDITNKIFHILLQKVTATNHDILREAIRRNLENYTKNIVNQINKRKKS